jgi:serine/threonine protein kinase
LLDQYEGNIGAYDVWSLGVIMLEIATGCPIYIAKKAIIIKAPEGSAAKDHQPTQPMMGKGLFGIESRQNHLSALLARQGLIVEKLRTSLAKCETYGIANNPAFIDLVTRMLALDPKKRISPEDIINHAYCASGTRN